MELFGKLKNKIIEKKEVKQDKQDNTELLSLWQERFRVCEEHYKPVITKMEDMQKLYDGGRKIPRNPNIQKEVTLDASNVQNIVYELIESQINSNIPSPKVDALNEEDEDRAVIIEEMLRGQLNRLPFEVLNDQDERVCPINGGSWFLIEWDNTIKTHNTVGDIQVTALHPKQVIPQAGVTDFRQGEYIFVLLTQTKEYIKRRYNVDVAEESEEYPYVERKEGENAKDLVTQIICYFKNDAGGVGLISWVNDTLLDYMEDYQARKQEVCKQCGAVRDGDTCICGSDKFKQSNLDDEIIKVAPEVNMPTPMPDMQGMPQMQGMQELGQGMSNNVPEIPGELNAPNLLNAPQQTEIRAPYYKPNIFPLVLRKNVSEHGKVLGTSDVEKIKDQQIAINKSNTVIDEKMYSGGSYVMLPEKKNIETTDKQLKVVRVKPEEVNLFRVVNIQPDMSYEFNNIQRNYNSAKDTLGITDSFQGKPDSTAQSGVAKEISARQSSGRLESKRRMKDAAYQEIFEIIFKFMLAYADEPRSFKTESNGKAVYKRFNRYDFLKKDDAGEYYYCDEFLFSCDANGELGSNRQYLWEQNRLNLQSGVFGDPANPETLLFFWQCMERAHYPNAKLMRAHIEKKVEEQKRAMQQQQAMQEQLQQQAMLQQAMQQQAMPPPPQMQAQGGMPPLAIDELPTGVEAQMGGGGNIEM